MKVIFSKMKITFILFKSKSTKFYSLIEITIKCLDMHLKPH